MKKIKIAISSCLIGNTVRYDGGHKRSSYCMDTLGDWFEYQPICPEMGVGMPSPRPAIHLVDLDGDIRVRDVKDKSLDWTENLESYAIETAPQLSAISGYIVIRNSPSCGMERVKVHRENGHPSNITGSGAFIGKLMELLPNLPVEEEGRLKDPKLRENYINRVFAYNDWQVNVLNNPSLHHLVDFHSRYKYLVMAHDYSSYKKLGQLVANDGSRTLQEMLLEYESMLMTTLKKVASPKSHINTLYHIAGYLKKNLSVSAKQEIIKVIEQYREEQVSLVTPIVLLNHYFNQYPNEYIQQQAYLNPHPIELGLRKYL